jgi:excisionase family DNA binding protein
MALNIAQPDVASLPEVLTTRQAAELLQLSVETIKAQAAAGMLPAAKVGREWRFSRRQLLAWIEAGGTLSEELVDRGLAAIVADQLAQGPEEDIPWEQVKSELPKED